VHARTPHTDTDIHRQTDRQTEREGVMGEGGTGVRERVYNSANSLKKGQ